MTSVYLTWPGASLKDPTCEVEHFCPRVTAQQRFVNMPGVPELGSQPACQTPQPVLSTAWRDLAPMRIDKFPILSTDKFSAHLGC